jgi:hypothetical protein
LKRFFKEVSRVSAVESERHFVQIGLQMLGTYPKSYEDALTKRTALQERKRDLNRRKPMKRGSQMKQSTKRMGPGRRMEDWAKVWRWLKVELEQRGRTKCEFHFIAHKCSAILTPAHSKKRRMIQEDEIYHVATACSTVHQILDEKMSHEDMEAAVMRAINENGGLILP